MAQAQPNPQVNAMCANIAARMYPLGIQVMPNVQAAHEEIQKITATLGDLNHGVKRNNFSFPKCTQRLSPSRAVFLFKVHNIYSRIRSLLLAP